MSVELTPAQAATVAEISRKHAAKVFLGQSFGGKRNGVVSVTVADPTRKTGWRFVGYVNVEGEETMPDRARIRREAEGE